MTPTQNAKAQGKLKSGPLEAPFLDPPHLWLQGPVANGAPFCVPHLSRDNGSMDVLSIGGGGVDLGHPTAQVLANSPTRKLPMPGGGGESTNPPQIIS